MTIKQLTAPEYHHVVGLFDAYRVFYQQPSDHERARHYIKARLDNSESVIFVAFEDSDGKSVPVGFTQLYPTYSSVRTIRNWILNDLYVSPDFRKSGIARQLISAAVNFAKANQATYIQLETAKDNLTAQKLYESLNFVQQSRESEFLLYQKSI